MSNWLVPPILIPIGLVALAIAVAMAREFGL